MGLPVCYFQIYTRYWHTLIFDVGTLTSFNIQPKLVVSPSWDVCSTSWVHRFHARKRNFPTFKWQIIAVIKAHYFNAPWTVVNGNNQNIPSSSSPVMVYYRKLLDESPCRTGASSLQNARRNARKSKVCWFDRWSTCLPQRTRINSFTRDAPCRISINGPDRPTCLWRFSIWVTWIEIERDGPILDLLEA